MKIPFGSFAPDQPPTVEFLVGGKNVVPKTSGALGPSPSFSSAYTALPLRVQGAFYSVDTSGNTALWAGTAGKLYRLAAGVAFSDVSKTATTYGVPADEHWEFEQFGLNVIACNFTDTIQNYIIGTSSLFADLSAGAPKARHMAVVANFLMLGNTQDGTFGVQPDGLWWSAINDPTSFPTPATSAAAAVQSGRVNISGRGGAIQRIVARVGTLDALVVQERQISRCIYVGSPDVFQFQPMEGAKGTPAPQSVAGFGGLMYYLGEDGFYVNDGTQSRPIGAGMVDDFFYSDVSQTKLDRVWGVVDPIKKLYIVGYPSQASSGGNIDKLLMYNYVTQKWAPPTTVNIEILTRLGSVGYTLEDLDAFGNVDTITTSFDSRFWMGDGKPALAAFDSAHRAGTFSGANLEAIVETGDIDAGSPRLLSGAVRPLVVGTNATVTASIGNRTTQNTAVNYGTYRALNRNQEVPIRVNDRHLRFLVKLNAENIWEDLIGLEFEGEMVSDI